MSKTVIKLGLSDQLPVGGLWPLLGIWVLVQSAFETAQDLFQSKKVQAEQTAACLNFCNPLPTVQPQRSLSGYAHKAVARHKGASRFCVLLRTWPYVRGRDGPG